jgi:hypothetical protein
MAGSYCKLPIPAPLIFLYRAILKLYTSSIGWMRFNVYVYKVSIGTVHVYAAFVPTPSDNTLAFIKNNPVEN